MPTSIISPMASAASIDPLLALRQLKKKGVCAFCGDDFRSRRGTQIRTRQCGSHIYRVPWISCFGGGLDEHLDQSFGDSISRRIPLYVVDEQVSCGDDRRHVGEDRNRSHCRCGRGSREPRTVQWFFEDQRISASISHASDGPIQEASRKRGRSLEGVLGLQRPRFTGEHSSDRCLEYTGNWKRSGFSSEVVWSVRMEAHRLINVKEVM